SFSGWGWHGSTYDPSSPDRYAPQRFWGRTLCSILCSQSFPFQKLKVSQATKNAPGQGFCLRANRSMSVVPPKFKGGFGDSVLSFAFGQISFAGTPSPAPLQCLGKK